MKFIDDEDRYELCSGRRFYAHRGIIGLSSNDDEVSEGYDGGVTSVLDDGRQAVGYGDEESDVLTPEEIRDIADTMIERWTGWRERSLAALKSAAK